MHDLFKLFRPEQVLHSLGTPMLLMPAELGDDEAAVSLGLGWICYGLALSLRAQTVLCVGSRCGVVPAVFGLALKHQASGKVHFVDASCDYEIDGLKSSAGSSRWREVGDRPFRELGLDNIFLTVSTTFDFTWRNGAIDLLFLDAECSFAGVKHDFEKFAPFADYVILRDANRTDTEPEIPAISEATEFPTARQFAATLAQPHVEIGGRAGLILVDNR